MAVRSLSDFDMVELGAGGIFGIKDGVKYLISQEEWREMNPEHRNTGCTECTFVQDQATLFTLFVSRELKETVGNDPVFVGKFTMPGWVGHSGFYLFKCKGCESVVVDYPHGYHGSYWYLRCKDCRHSLDMSSSKFRHIYQENNGFIPKFLEEIGGWFRRQFARPSVGVKTLN